MPSTPTRSKNCSGRQKTTDSVYNGLCQADSDAAIILIHDIVRPLVRNEHIDAVIDKVKKPGAAILAAPMKAAVRGSWRQFSHPANDTKEYPLDGTDTARGSMVN